MSAPPRSLALGLYLALSGRAEGFASRLLARRQARGKEDAARLGERLGHAGVARPPGPVVWFHAASVGEFAALVELLRRLHSARPDITLLLTTGTVTSAEMAARADLPGVIHQYVPLDARAAVRRFVAHWQVDVAIWTESELWPALIHETHRSGAVLLLVNARISTRSSRRWRLARGLVRGLLSRFDMIFAQDADSARHLRRLGAEGGRIATIGTLKEGAAPLPYDEAERARLGGRIGARPLWLAASTHPGEEELVGAAHAIARRAAPRLLCLIVPRHPERGEEVAARLSAAGWRVGRRSRGDVPEDETDIYVADTLGELGLWYRLAPVSFVGGSLGAAAEEIGGHNPFEPAALGSAILHGPHVANFAEPYRRLTRAGAARAVVDEADLAGAVTELLEPEVAAIMARAAWDTCSDGALVTERVLTEILGHLPAAP
ncbi:MAG: 3-deoxy-D-manno-octulosonic acid transferase [Pseudomonadota bacterium]